MKHLGGEVTTEGPPGGTIRSGTDIMLVTGDKFSGGECFGTIGEDGGVMNESMVGDITVGDENGGSRTDSESDDGTVFVVEGFEIRFELGEGFPEP